MIVKNGRQVLIGDLNDGGGIGDLSDGGGIGDLIGALGGASLATLSRDQQSICAAAAAAAARSSPAAAGLGQQCLSFRQQSAAAGRFAVDGYPIDPAYRVAITDAGNAVIAGSPQLQAARAAQPAARRRGFTMGVAVRSGQADPAFVAALRANVGPDDLAGFDAATSGTQQASGDAGGAAAGGVPKAVVIGGAAVAVLAVAAVIYKFTLAR